VAPDAPDTELLASVASAPAGVQPPYFLMVGTIEPRKNHLTALRAFRGALQRRPGSGARLVLAGSPGWLYEPVERAIVELELQTRVLRLGRVDRGTLKWLYQHAQALLFPSFYEGFGIPVVEAFALDCPVIAARIPAVCEVAGEGTAALIPAADVEAWTESIVAAIDGTAPSRIEAARRRAASFSWAASAEAVRQALESALGPDRAGVGRPG
jgi:glycosyltransferase involved in cell wall biosynthesis